MRKRFLGWSRLLVCTCVCALFMLVMLGVEPALAKKPAAGNSPPIKTEAWLKKICLTGSGRDKGNQVPRRCVGYVQGVVDGLRIGWTAGAVTAAGFASKSDFKHIVDESARYQATRWFCIPQDVTDAQIAAVVRHYLRHPLMGIDSKRNAPAYVEASVATRWPCRSKRDRLGRRRKRNIQ